MKTTNTTNRQRIADSIHRAHTDIDNLFDLLNQELKREAAPTWAEVGTLEHLRETLIETLASFSGISETEIKRHLEENH